MTTMENMDVRELAAEGLDGALLDRITVVPGVFGGKPVIRGRRLAVEHILGLLAAGDDEETILAGYAWLEPDDIRACLAFGERMGHSQDFQEDREWRDAVDVFDVDSTALRATHEPECEQEWVEAVEPNYDSEAERCYRRT